MYNWEQFQTGAIALQQDYGAKDMVQTVTGRSNSVAGVNVLLAPIGIYLVFKKNYLTLPDELNVILNAIDDAGGKVFYWKFYQYMSYDLPEKDNMHTISITLYNQFKERVKNILDGGIIYK